MNRDPELIYVAFLRLPTEKAHGAQIVKTCEALARQGTSLELWVPDRPTPIKESVEAYYGIRSQFPIRRFPTIETLGWGRAGFVLQSLLFAFSVRAGLFGRKNVVVYCRDEIVVTTLLFLGVERVVWESHDGAWNTWARYAVRHVQALVVVSGGLRAFYVERGVPEENISVIRNGIDLEAFEKAESKEKARARLALPQAEKIALYVGALDGWKGTDTLLKASQVLSQDERVVIIGGSTERIAALKREYPSVIFVGQRPQSELADNLASADVVVLPNTGTSEIATKFTSPLKLLAYMASGRPIVATDLPATRELVDETSAYLVPADDPLALAEGIKESLRDTTSARRRTDVAKEAVRAFSWEERAKTIASIFF